MLTFSTTLTSQITREIREHTLKERRIFSILTGLIKMELITSSIKEREFISCLQMCLGWMLTQKRDMTIKRGTWILSKQDRNSFLVKFFHRLITRHSLLLRNKLKNRKTLIVNLTITIVIYLIKWTFIKDQLNRIQQLALNPNGILLNRKLKAGNSARVIMRESRRF